MTDDMNGYQWLRAYALEPEPCERVKVRRNQWAARTSFHSGEIYHGRALPFLCRSKKGRATLDTKCILWHKIYICFCFVHVLIASTVKLHRPQLGWLVPLSSCNTRENWGLWFVHGHCRIRWQTYDSHLGFRSSLDTSAVQLHWWYLLCGILGRDVYGMLWAVGTALPKETETPLSLRIISSTQSCLNFFKARLFSWYLCEVAKYRMSLRTFFVDGKCEMQSEVAYLGLQSKPAAGGIEGRSGS